MNIFKKLLTLWVWLVVIVFASPASFAYDFQSWSNYACDGRINSASCYDGAAVFTTNESDNHSVSDRTPLVNFARFLAAEGTAAGALPELQISAGKYPDLAANIYNAQQAGYPDVLTVGGDAAANRAAALEGIPNFPPLTRDEYPFASSMEGGASTWVGYVPAAQNQAQGGLISSFISANNLVPGSQYRVVIVP